METAFYMHAWTVTHQSNLDVDALREQICAALKDTTPRSAWRRDTHFDLQTPGSTEDEAEHWEVILQVAQPHQMVAKYLWEVHTRALAIATGNTVIVLNERDRLRSGPNAPGTLGSPDLVTVFLPDPNSTYVGVQQPNCHSGRGTLTFRKYPGNKYSWDDFKTYWNTLTTHEKQECSVLVYNGETLHYSGTRLQQVRSQPDDVHTELHTPSGLCRVALTIKNCIIMFLQSWSPTWPD